MSGSVRAYPTKPKVLAHQAFTVRDAPERTGDCWRTAIAILLGLHRDEVPDFIWEHPEGEGSDWFDEARAWLRRRGWSIEYLPAIAVMAGHAQLPDHGWMIAGGTTTRSLHHWTHDEPWAHHYRGILQGEPIFHAVVMRHDLSEYYDPLADGDGLSLIHGFDVIYRELTPEEGEP